MNSRGRADQSGQLALFGVEQELEPDVESAIAPAAIAAPVVEGAGSIVQTDADVAASRQPGIGTVAPMPLDPEASVPPSPGVAPDSGIEPVGDPIDEDEAARRFAVDPRNNVVLEASAGTGKTSVLVSRYVNLLKAGVEPANILAITFTRKAAAEMRERIIGELRDSASLSNADRKRWADLRDRLGEIAISTIDAFCLSLLREFPLEADVDPGFDMADETEVPRLIEEALDQSLRIFTRLARTEPDVALVLAQLGLSRTREGLAALLDRRLVAWGALDRFLTRGPANLSARIVCQRALTSLQDTLRTVPGGLARFLDDGPAGHPRYQLLIRELRRLSAHDDPTDAEIRALLDRLAAHFLTAEGRPRASGAIYPYKADHYPSADAARRHRGAVAQLAPQIERVVEAFARDLNAIMARGIRRMFAIALSQYRRALDERSVLDFSDVLQRALDLLRQMDEFAQSRYRLESRYHHVLVDEFQDTSRAQWELVSLLVQSWREGLGIATQPSVFIVGDRKQSIYRFRDAEVAVLQEAGRYIEALRPGGSSRRSIARSFRAVPALLAFVNDAFRAMSQNAEQAHEFSYGDTDCFPIDPATDVLRGQVLGLAVADDAETSAAAVAAEIARILKDGTIRDRRTGVPRQATPGDIAVLFRSRASHREFERELERLGIPTYVYKGLGFFDADETKDVIALIRYLARPVSDLRAAAFLRSRFVRLSDRALSALAPGLAAALIDAAAPAALDRLDDEDRRVLVHTRAQVAGWLERVDRVPPADLLETLLSETAYAYELRGPRRLQAWENLKKIRGMIRRIQNRGYATLPRLADHIDALTAGDESNAVIEALDAVNLMTVHASKGLEFPIVFVVNMAKGAGGIPKPVRVIANGDEPSVSIGPFVSEVDEADRAREKHELRRLLYVGFTRARDRLYLSSAMKSGVLAPGRGSLAEVLPESFRNLFARAAAAPADETFVTWAGASGHTFRFLLCRPPVPLESGTQRARRDPATPAVSEIVEVRAAPLSAAPARMPVSEVLDRPDFGVEPVTRASSDALIGRLVHRLFQFAATHRPHGPVADHAPDVRRRASELLTAEERATLDDPGATLDAAAAAWASLAARADVGELLEQGQPQFEVPFSFYDPASGHILRGAIDCLVRRPDGGLTVVEFKTGRPRTSHEQQLSIYVRATRAIFPGAVVEGLLIYA